jgi:hypothetical protein
VREGWLKSSRGNSAVRSLMLKRSIATRWLRVLILGVTASTLATFGQAGSLISWNEGASLPPGN